MGLIRGCEGRMQGRRNREVMFERCRSREWKGWQKFESMEKCFGSSPTMLLVRVFVGSADGKASRARTRFSRQES